MLHVPLVFFKTDGNLHGFMSNGALFLNVDSKMSLPQVFHHEAFHWLKANNPAMYAEVLDHFRGAARFGEKQLEKWREKTGRLNLSDDEVIEEMLCDEFEDVAKRTELLESMAKENPSLLARFVAWLKNLRDRFTEHFHNPEGRLTTAQRDSFVAGFGKTIRNLRDNDGKRIFSTYRTATAGRLNLPTGGNCRR